MAQINRPQFKIRYGAKDITRDISAALITVTYTDVEEGESDEITFTLADPEGQWRDEWYPKKGDSMELEIGYDDALMPCGKFVIDEMEINFGSSGDTVTIKALAAGINKKLRTKRSVGHENQSLKQIAEKVASANGLTVKGEVPNILFTRITQNRESDLAFLHRVSREYGCMFAVRDNALVFTSIFGVEKGEVVKTIDRTDCIGGRWVDKSVQTYKKASAKYHSPTDKKLISGEAESGGKADDGSSLGGDKISITSEDALEIRTKAENEQQARIKAQAALHRANSREQEGYLSVYGDPLLVAGNNFLFTGMGKLSGKCHITKSTHRIDRSGGYVTEVEFYRLKDTEKPAQRKPRKRYKKRTSYTPTSSGGGGGGYGDRSLITQSD